jgi:HK97 family phage major capsid protein
MNRIHARDKRRWFQVHCCKSVVVPTEMSQFNLMAFSLVMVGIVALLVFGLTAHHLAAAGTTGLLMANAPIATTEIKGQLDTILLQIKENRKVAEDEQKKFGTMLEETKTKLEGLQKQADALDIKLAERHAAAAPDESLEQFLQKDDGLKRIMRDKSGTHVITFDAKQTQKLFERKTTITSTAVGSATTGILQIERTPGIVQEARQQLMIRDALTSRPTTLQLVDFVKVNAPLAIGSPQTEASDKAQNAATFTTKSERVQTLATWIPATKQVLDDFTELMGFLQTGLPYYVNLDEELELLLGSGSDPHLDGLITQATAYNTALTPAVGGWTRIDIVGRVIQQITTAKELQPTFIVLNPVDIWSMRLTKDSQGRYILGDPMQPLTSIFGLTPIVTTNVAVGTFLVGSGSPIACEIRDRMGMTIEIATQHSDYFVKNMIAIRAEKRLALVVYRPASFITGTFSTSPAGN